MPQGGNENWLLKGTEFLLWMTKMFIELTVVVHILKTTDCVHIKQVNCMVCKFIFIKLFAVSKR